MGRITYEILELGEGAPVDGVTQGIPGTVLSSGTIISGASSVAGPTMPDAVPSARNYVHIRVIPHDMAARMAWGDSSPTATQSGAASMSLAIGLPEVKMLKLGQHTAFIDLAS